MIDEARERGIDLNALRREAFSDPQQIETNQRIQAQADNYWLWKNYQWQPRATAYRGLTDVELDAIALRLFGNLSEK